MKEIKFKDFIKLNRGFDLPNDKMNVGEFPVVASTSIKGYHNEYKIIPPVVVTGRSGSLGSVQYIEKACTPLNTTLYVKDFKGNNPKYVYYYLKMMHLEMYNSGAGVPTLNQNHLHGLKIKVHKIEDQEKITIILSAYDDLIEANNHRIELLERSAQELYKEWFVRFRFPGHEKVKLINGLPEGWQIKRMSEFCYVTDGTHDTPKPVDVGVPLVTGRCISLGFIDFSVAYNISETDHKNIKKRSGLKSGDIIFSNIGTVGNCCIIDYDREFSVKNVIIFKPKSVRDTAYLYYWMTSSTMQEVFASQTNGASQQFVGLTFMRGYKLLVPKDDILDIFADKVLPIIEQKRLLYQNNLNLITQRDILLPRMMSGKLEV